MNPVIEADEYLALFLPELVYLLDEEHPGAWAFDDDMAIGGYRGVPEYHEYGRSMLDFRADALLPADSAEFIRAAADVMRTLVAATRLTRVQLVAEAPARSLVFFASDSAVELVVKPEGWLAARVTSPEEAIRTIGAYLERDDVSEWALDLRAARPGLAGLGWGRDRSFAQRSAGSDWTESAPLSRQAGADWARGELERWLTA